MGNLIIPKKTLVDGFTINDFKTDINTLKSDTESINNETERIKSKLSKPTYIQLYIIGNRAPAINTLHVMPFTKAIDDNDEWDNTTNSCTIKETGIYCISYNQFWTGSSSGNTITNEINVGTNNYQLNGDKWGIGTNNTSINGSITVKAVVGDVINFKYSFKVTDTLFGNNNGGTWATIVRID